MPAVMVAKELVHPWIQPLRFQKWAQQTLGAPINMTLTPSSPSGHGVDQHNGKATLVPVSADHASQCSQRLKVQLNHVRTPHKQTSCTFTACQTPLLLQATLPQSPQPLLRHTSPQRYSSRALRRCDLREPASK
jgi:hypothetical protein